MSIIEYILQTPNSRNFIQICLYCGLDFYKVSYTVKHKQDVIINIPVF